MNPKHVYYVVCEGNAAYSNQEFTSRREAEKYIARLRRVYPALVREKQRFTIHQMRKPDAAG